MNNSFEMSSYIAKYIVLFVCTWSY